MSGFATTNCMKANTKPSLILGSRVTEHEKGLSVAEQLYGKDLDYGSAPRDEKLFIAYVASSEQPSRLRDSNLSLSWEKSHMLPLRRGAQLSISSRVPFVDE